ncbi:antibiotic biosynthesis monooxygenase [Pseudomonas capsici]|uniref:antibiotic biosynthesis monooxygenase n=1 Tax=Pseudomonas capsici TaxID=2810614 RepID=UPI0021F1FAD3|nr:antibiotic biosynthesis monooxygenase [Pseudomonas capsici]MCV4339523.1 antibiotic biosynthesis monooxygenase [Pseudomonas capsici]
MPISLTSQWFIQPGQEMEARQALMQLALDVQASEPGTLTYLVHTPFGADARLQSLPPPDPLLVLFFETYASPDAFLAHVNGPLFTGFVAQHGHCFVSSNGKPYTTVQFLDTLAGFSGRSLEETEVAANRHPAVMFEIIARDSAAAKAFYQQVFGWQYQTGTGGFSYIHFPAGIPPLLGGIGQADPAIPGFEPGHNFYLLVDALEPVLEAALAAGGSALMPPAAIDGYRFAMFKDPEGNPVGLIEPFNT